MPEITREEAARLRDEATWVEGKLSAYVEGRGALIAAAPDLAERVATEPERIAAAVMDATEFIRVELQEQLDRVVAEAERRAWERGLQAGWQEHARRVAEGDTASPWWEAETRNPYPAASVDRTANAVAEAEADYDRAIRVAGEHERQGVSGEWS